MRAPTATLDELEIHVTTLSPGDAFLHPDANAPDELDATVLALMGPSVPPRERSLAEAGGARARAAARDVQRAGGSEGRTCTAVFERDSRVADGSFREGPPGSVSLVKVGLDTALLAAEATRTA